MAALQYKDDQSESLTLGRKRLSEDFGAYPQHNDGPLCCCPKCYCWVSMELVATIDGREVVVTESLIRTQLHFEDTNGIVAMPNSDILEGENYSFEHPPLLAIAAAVVKDVLHED
ncbi:hypothetical protein Tco_0551159 [Tanacetum coccineum]